MDFVVHQHKFAQDIIKSNPELSGLWNEIANSISSISDEDLIVEFGRNPNSMSISNAINVLLDAELQKRDWIPQSRIFQGEDYEGKTWRLDFSKRSQSATSGISGIAIEVAFNHGEAIAWNLLKPVLAAEINHVDVQTDIGAGIGIYICATDELKASGAFDNAVGEYEKVIRYLEPLAQKLTVPMLIVGLKAPNTFKVEKQKNRVTGKNRGVIVRI